MKKCKSSVKTKYKVSSFPYGGYINPYSNRANILASQLSGLQNEEEGLLNLNNTLGIKNNTNSINSLLKGWNGYTDNSQNNSEPNSQSNSSDILSKVNKIGENYSLIKGLFGKTASSVGNVISPTIQSTLGYSNAISTPLLQSHSLYGGASSLLGNTAPTLTQTLPGLTGTGTLGNTATTTTAGTATGGSGALGSGIALAAILAGTYGANAIKGGQKYGEMSDAKAMLVNSIDPAKQANAGLNDLLAGKFQWHNLLDFLPLGFSGVRRNRDARKKQQEMEEAQKQAYFADKEVSDEMKLDNYNALYNNNMAYGGDIKIKPENKGKFTNWANIHGLSVQDAANQVLSAKEGKYSSSVRRMANFARNFGGNKSYGGELDKTITLPTVPIYGRTDISPMDKLNSFIPKFTERLIPSQILVGANSPYQKGKNRILYQNVIDPKTGNYKQYVDYDYGTGSVGKSIIYKPYGGELNSVGIPDANSQQIAPNAELITNSQGGTTGTHETGQNIPVTNEQGQQVANVEPGEVVVNINGREIALSKRLGFAQKYQELNAQKQSIVNEIKNTANVTKRNTLIRNLDKVDKFINQLPLIQEQVKKQYGIDDSGMQKGWGDEYLNSRGWLNTGNVPHVYPDQNFNLFNYQPNAPYATTNEPRVYPEQNFDLSNFNSYAPYATDIPNPASRFLLPEDRPRPSVPYMQPITSSQSLVTPSFPVRKVSRPNFSFKDNSDLRKKDYSSLSNILNDSSLLGGIASIASNYQNKNLLNKSIKDINNLQYQSFNPAPYETRVDNSAQLAEIRNAYSEGNKMIDMNTSSSNTATARKLALQSNRLNDLSKVYEATNNQERTLRNANIDSFNKASLFNTGNRNDLAKYKLEGIIGARGSMTGMNTATTTSLLNILKEKSSNSNQQYAVQMLTTALNSNRVISRNLLNTLKTAFPDINWNNLKTKE